MGGLGEHWVELSVPDFRTFSGQGSTLWTVWRSTVPVTSTCRLSPWAPALTRRCGPTTPWPTPTPTSLCSSPTPTSCALWGNSGKPAMCTPSASPRGSSWSAWPWRCARRWQFTVSGPSPSTWTSSRSATTTMTTSCPISGSTPCRRSSSSSGIYTKVALCAWGWDAAPPRTGGGRGGAVNWTGSKAGGSRGREMGESFPCNCLPH